jgi:transposase
MKVVGIDISKDHFDLHLLPEGNTARYANDTDGIRQCRLFLAQVQPERIVLEATGGYELALTMELQTAAMPVIVVNPRRVRDYAKSQGWIAKTDRIDARVLAEFATSPRLPVRELPDAQTRQRKALIARKHQLVEIHVAERNHLEHATDRVLTQSIRSALYMPLLAVIRCNPAIRQFYQRLVDHGKAKMTALVAALRKLLTIANTMLKNDQLWNPKTT